MAVAGDLGSLYVGDYRTASDLLSDLTVGARLSRLTVYGDVEGQVTVGGDLRALTVGSRRAPAALLGGLDVAGSLSRATIYGDVHGQVLVGNDLGTFSAGLICNNVTVAGDLRSLTTASELLPGVAPVDFLFDNPDPDPDGELIVGGSIRRVRSL